MEEFLNKLYSYEYFGIYLIISIVVLVLLFIVILFFGKKDQKEREIIATKKLQQINNDAFKDDSIEEKLEVTNEEKLENDTIIVPTIDEVPSIMEISENEIPEPVLPVSEDTNVEEIIEPAMDVPVVEETPVLAKEPEVIEEIAPLLDKIEEKPLVFNDINIEPEEKVVDIKLEAPVVEKEEIEVPTFDFDEIVKSVEETKKEQTYTKGPEIFSSVYVPEKEIELPKVEEPEVKIENDLGFELPTLKKTTPVEELKEEVITEVKEEKIEMPVLNDYNLDNLSGETYTINK